MELSERDPAIGEVSLERMVRAVEKVRNRLLRAAAALEAAKIDYAVVGGNAVAARRKDQIHVLDLAMWVLLTRAG